MTKGIFVVVGALLLSGCYHVTKVSPPALTAYESFVKSDSTKAPMVAALKDFDTVAEYCWTRSNNYEIRTKNAEFWRLGVGAGGGVMGFTGAMLAAAGTGGFAPAISAGLAGVASITLGSAEKGPLAPAAFMRERDGIASLIITRANEVRAESDPDNIYKLAIALKHSCRSLPGSKEES
ncbi:hypothetical protein [Pseudomonas sp. G166]|uniref:hypothetical protein n=1 Tax=Pseudomonas sp. G166 TaxID=3094846 RepID=UPI00300B1272